MEIFKFNFIVHIAIMLSFLTGMVLSFFFHNEPLARICLCIVLIGEIINMLLMFLLTKCIKRTPFSAAEFGDAWRIPKDDIKTKKDLEKKIGEMDLENRPYDDTVYQVTYKSKIGFLYHETREILTKKEYEELLTKNGLIAVEAKTKEKD